jgi:hypothetical protein
LDFTTVVRTSFFALKILLKPSGYKAYTLFGFITYRNPQTRAVHSGMNVPQGFE